MGRVINLPKRRISSIEELKNEFPQVKDFVIDATERSTQKPKSSKLNKRRFSGKKRAHTRKNTIICDIDKIIFFASPTKDGQMYDLKQFKSTGVIEKIHPDTIL